MMPHGNSSMNGQRQLSLPRELSRPLSSNDDRSTEMITIALAKAQNAVLLDQRNNVTAALDGYSQCCAILAEVIEKETDADDITRLRQIHDTYSVRMHVLSEMQMEPNAVRREMPPLPTQADLEDFEDEEDEGELLTNIRRARINRDTEPLLQAESRYSDVRPLHVQTARPPLSRSSSSRDSTAVYRVPPSPTKYSHSRNTSYSQTHSSWESLEQTPTTPSTFTFRSSFKREAIDLPEMIDEEMDDAAFLERITRGFTSDEEILVDEDVGRPSTSSTASSIQNRPKKSIDGFVFEHRTSRVEPDDFVLPSPPESTPAPRQTSPTPKLRHDRSRNTSSPFPSGSANERPSSPRKNLSINGAQPMLKSLSANNAVPDVDETVGAGSTDGAPDLPPKVKRRPQLIRVVSESTMRSNYGSRLSTFDVSPLSPPSTASILTPGTRTSSTLLTDVTPNLISRDREGAVAPEEPPADPSLRPYWLMRALALSIKNPKGAYINNRLFVPQGAWTMKNVKLKAMDEKIQCFQTLSMAIRQVLEIDGRNISLFLQVSEFSPSIDKQETANLEGTVDMAQQSISRKMDGKTNGSNGTNEGKMNTRKMSQARICFAYCLTSRQIYWVA